MLKRLRSIVARFNPIRLLRRGWLGLVNRRRRFAKVDYITFTLPAQMPALPEPRDWLRRRILGAPPLSLLELERIFERIGDDPRPKGIILHLRGAAMPLADLQTLRASIGRLRGRGKHVICFAQSYTNGTYYLASAADEIILQPGGELDTVGLRAAATFFKDAFDRLGVQVDSVAISPYKSAYDSFTRHDISTEAREQLGWLLDSQFEMLVNGIAEGRKVTSEAARVMIDTAPHLDEEALAAGYVDAVLSEEGLHRRLDSKHVLPWHRAGRILIQKWRKQADKYVALLRIGGLMLPGDSGEPPVDLPIPFIGGERAGDLTVVQQVRRLMQDKTAAAVVVFVDSGGGAVSAAEAMTSALDELAQDRPVVVYMNGTAASGGYYVATAARWIVAQPGTITGSIGVLSAKIVTAGLRDQIGIQQVEFLRGANANLLSDAQPYTAVQRARAEQTMQHIYRQFVERVMRSRKMSFAAVDAVSSGRVWTGAQAQEHGLLDELGDLHAALARARAFAQLPPDAPLGIIHGKGRPLPAQIAEQSNPAATWKHLTAGLSALGHGAPLLLLPLTWDISDPG